MTTMNHIPAPDWFRQHDFTVESDGTRVAVVEGCGCVLRMYPSGGWTDSGCSYHLPHDSVPVEADSEPS